MKRRKESTGYPLYQCRNCQTRFIPLGTKRVKYWVMQNQHPQTPTTVTIYDGEEWHKIPLLVEHRCADYLMGVADLIGLSQA